jgi:hypothetical protein
MHIFGYIAIGFLAICVLLAATKALSVESWAAVVISVAVADATRSPRQPISGQILQQQNQTDCTPELSQELAEEEEDLLNMLD